MRGASRPLQPFARWSIYRISDREKEAPCSPHDLQIRAQLPCCGFQLVEISFQQDWARLKCVVLCVWDLVWWWLLFLS